MSEKLPPNNVEAERAMLGSALIDPGVVELLRERGLLADVAADRQASAEVKGSADHERS